MKKTTVLPSVMFIAICLLFVSARAQELNTLTAKEKQEGWELLFDGKDLKGWHSYLESHPGAAWEVMDGSIVLNKNSKSKSADYQDITTDDEFENFDLKLEWKLKPCENSGIMFYVHEAPQYHETFETGPEMQVVDLNCSPDSHVALHKAGALYDLITVSSEPVTKGGEWNHVEILSDHGHLQLFLNGKNVIDTHLWDAHWKALIAKSKFATMPNFGTFHKGHVSFQGTEPGTKVWYRNIKIRKL